MFAAVPLMLVPLILYNLVMIGFFGGGGIAALSSVVFSVAMLSGATWSLTLADVLVIVALLLLFVEILKATSNGTGSLLNHMLSMIVFVGFLVEFLLVRDAATQIFFILMLIAFIDVVAGFSISIRSASRDVSIGL